jgi:hypothetical protein
MLTNYNVIKTSTVERTVEIQSDKTVEALPAQLLTGPPGVIIAQQRTDRIIESLKNETLEDSLSNLDKIDYFEYPGYISEVFGGTPFDIVQEILSNRRFIKLYAELRSTDKIEQYNYLHKTFNDKLSKYHNLLSRFQFDDPNLTSEDYLDLSRASDIPGKSPTMYGTRLAVVSIALLSGLLGNVKMWPEIQQLFRHPLIGREISTEEFKQEAIRTILNNHPLFPTGIQMQVIWLMSQYSNEDDAKLYDLDIKKVKAIVPDKMIRTMEIQNYQSRITQYDLNSRSAMGPIDRSYGSHIFQFLVIDNVFFMVDQRKGLLEAYNTDLFEKLINKYGSVEKGN